MHTRQSMPAKKQADFKHVYRVYANRGNEYVKAFTVDAAIQRVKRRMMKLYGSFYLGGVEMKINGNWEKIV